MLKKIFTVKISLIIFPIILVFISLFICYKNYTPGTYLTGWDTLHPEFNYGIYLKRIILGAWQSHQGLGSPASQAHASEIPRIMIIGLLDFFFATSFIRYLFAFLMLILGSLGVYFFLKKIIFKNSDHYSTYAGSFLGGLFYLLNLGTLQHFNVPLEMFLVQYAFLGWIFLFLTSFYQGGRKKDLIWFAVINFFGAPQAHTPTLFYVYVMFLFLYLFLMIVLDLFSKEKTLSTHKSVPLKRSALIFLLTLLINSFWLLPNIYYGIDKGKEVPLSKIHHLFSEEAFLVNKKYGNIKDISILKNFLFDWGVYTQDDSYGSLLKPWVLHLKKPLVSTIGYSFSFFILIGAVFSVIKKEKKLIPWLFIGFVSIFFILNVNPPFGFIFVFFQENIPLFKELFRFPFTKFSIFLMFVYALFFGYCCFLIIDFVNKKLPKIIGTSVFALLSLCVVYFSLPAFKGNLINPAMRVNIPDRYFEMFDYFNQKEEYGRVLHLPIHSFWGWVTYSWDDRVGYQGAGFLWFGIKQPLIDREFDRWNIANEQPYREISTAIYSQDKDLLQKYLKKYKIKWLILDKSVVSPGLDRKILFHKEIEDMFSSLQGISIGKDFGDGLVVYEYSPSESFQRTEKITSSFASGNSLFKEYYDPIYTKYGNYVSDEKETHQFLGFNSVDENIDNSLVYSDEKAVYFKLPYGDNKVGEMGSIPVSLFLNNSGEGRWSIDIKFDGTVIASILLNIESNNEYFLKFNDDHYIIDPSNTSNFIGDSVVSLKDGTNFSLYIKKDEINVDEILYSNLENCDLSGYGTYSSYSISKISSGFRITGKNTVACVTSSASKFINLGYRGPILVSFNSDKTISSEDFCLLDNKSGLCVDKLLVGRYFISDLIQDSNSYDLRFFADGRNQALELTRQYTDINIFLTERVSEGILSYFINDSSKTKGYLTFPKKDYLTIEPEGIEGNRRACQQGNDLNESNFIDTGAGVIFNSTDSSLCDSYVFPLASHKNGYLLEVRASFIDGVPLRICLTNEYSKRCDIEVSLPNIKSTGSYFYLVPPLGDGVGYTVNISNYVFGNTNSTNELKYLSLIPLSYNTIKNIEVSSESLIENHQTFVLNEAYDPGWVAICGFGKCDAKHVKVNNWANGWVFENGIPNHVNVIFWPQLLEYFGFGFLGISILILFKYKEKRPLDSMKEKD
ncbi:hypothetical protein KA062_01615 [Patescibacteria group bacterium]|nr:hypothetical protein [Patescibacteria group bacterium]